MMTLRDSVLLAAAKLKTHRVRTGIIVTIASLLFAGIVLVLTILTGAARSMQSFGTEGLGSRYIVQAQPIYNQSVMFTGTTEMVDTFKARTTVLKAEKKAAAKRLNITYDPSNDITLPLNETKNQSGGTEYYLNTSHPEVKEALNTYANNLQHIRYDDFKALAKKFGAKAVYRSTLGTGMGGNYMGYQGGDGATSVAPIVDGKEQSNDSAKGGAMGEPRGVGTLTTLGWTYFDRDIMTPFVLPGQSLAVGKEGDIPVVAPISAVEQMLGLTSLPSTASAQQRLDRVVYLRQKIAGNVASLCYRNATSLELLNQAKQQEKDIAANKGKAGYTAPSLQYNVPTEPCGAVTVKKDTRSADEKKQSANELSFKQQYENYQEADQQILKVRVVGFSQDMSYQMGFSARAIVETVLKTGLGDGWFSPTQAISEGSVADKIKPAISKRSSVEQMYYAEFNDLASAKQFAKETSCQSSASMGMMMGPPQAGQEDPRVVDCYKQGKYFDVSPFGNNASAIEDLRRGVWKVMRYVAPVVLVLASLVLMGIVGKIIADSRRETAVFRALGATRFAVAQIYLTYSLFIAAFIMLLAFIIGSGGALLISQKLTPDASVSAVLAYNAQDVHKQFTFYGVDVTYVALVLGLVVLSALLSTVLPLLTNIRRNPIRDMRDEN